MENTDREAAVHGNMVSMGAPESQPLDEDVGCGLYVHIPFCETKCGYCDFFSVPLKGRATLPLVRCVCRELGRRGAECPYEIRTVFLGGGTPTLLPARELKMVLDTIASVRPIGELEECTVEANPATVDDETAETLIRAGVGRVSMGAQSFFSGELDTLERLHTPDDIGPSVQLLRRHGIAQVSLDLIFGIPGQTIETWSASLASAIALGVDHISAYGLTFEPRTRLTALRAGGRITPCDEHLEADMYLLGVEKLAEAGFEQYEISNFARPGCRCRHNLTYWRNGPYIGVGPSGAGFIRKRRYKNIEDVGGYVRMMETDGNAEVASETLDIHAIATELIMMQLRLVEGLSLASFARATGTTAWNTLGDSLPRLKAAGLINVSNTHVAVTDSGRLVTDAIIRDLVDACCVDGATDSQEAVAGNN